MKLSFCTHHTYSGTFRYFVDTTLHKILYKFISFLEPFRSIKFQ